MYKETDKIATSHSQHRNENIAKKSLQSQNDVIAPSYVDCGISEINIPGVFNHQFTCTADAQPVIYEISMEPSSAKGITIDSKTGTLAFSNYHEEFDVTLTVKAINGAGFITTSIKLKNNKAEEKDGIWVKFRTLDKKECDDENFDVTVQGTYYKIIPNLSGLDSEDTNYYTWYQLLGLTSLSQTHSFIAELEGHINIDTAGIYQFISTISEGMIIKVFIDDLQTPLLFNEKCTWEEIEDLPFDIELSAGEHIVYIQLYSFKSYYSSSCSWIFNFQYKKPDDETPSAIPFKTRILYIFIFILIIIDDSTSHPVYDLSLEKNEFVLLYDAVSTINFRVSGSSKYTCKFNDGETLPTGLQLTENAILGNPQEEQESIKTYHLTCSNEYSITNTFTFTLKVTSIIYLILLLYRKIISRNCWILYEN